MKIYTVFLRRPKGLRDRRNDPFWEFGSFGRTGCHRANLLHPERTPLTAGDRLAFIQGGRSELRIIGLTPPIKVEGFHGKIELTWNREYQPIPFEQAPILIANNGASDFESITPLIIGVNRSTLCGAAASKLRARTKPIDDELAQEVESYFEKTSLPRITRYYQAIAPSDNSWVQSAEKQNWASPEERQSEYDRPGI